MEEDLRTALVSIVKRFGFEKVHEALHEIVPPQTTLNSVEEPALPKRPRNKGARTKPCRSAVKYVCTIDMTREKKTRVIERAAREFDRRTFLPTVGDLRSFCEVYGIEEPKSKSRASGIPRIFKFLATMETVDVEKILNNRMFSGPTELGPIADAIRSKSKRLELVEPSAPQCQTETTSDSGVEQSLTQTQTEH